MSETKIRYIDQGWNRYVVFDLALTEAEAEQIAPYLADRKDWPLGPTLVTVLRTESLTGWVLSFLVPGWDEPLRLSIPRSPVGAMGAVGYLDRCYE